MHMQDKTVSVFETTIRILGGLLSAHLIASDYATVYCSLEVQYYVCYLKISEKFILFNIKVICLVMMFFTPIFLFSAVWSLEFGVCGDSSISSEKLRPILIVNNGMILCVVMNLLNYP